METHYTSFDYKARYFQLGELTSQTKNLIFVIHGYGQQAKYFIQKFKGLANGTNCIIAPEGLSRFYLDGFSGKIGATWMTKEDRLTDIENYITYLNAVFAEVMASLKEEKRPKITLLGFSQGAATVSRWVANCIGHIDQLILWAGIFPPDLDYTLAVDRFKDIDIKYVYGLNDPYLTESRLKEMKDISSHLQVKPATITFDGEHIIDPETLEKIFSD